MCNQQHKDLTNKELLLNKIDKVESLHFSKLESKYLKAMQINTALAYIVFMATTLLILLFEESSFRNIALISIECIFFITLIFNIFILKNAFHFRGYALREHDISYRKGIIFPSVITIPFCKIQQVSVRQNPLTRMLGLYAIDIVNGAQDLNRTTIPGLTEERANEIKAIITERTANENE